MENIDFNLHKIFVEGNTDQACVERILELRYGITFPKDGVDVKDAIISCNGWTNLSNQPALVDSFRKENGGKNLVIFDSDTSNNQGGYQKRYEEITAIAESLGIKFEIYLLPNNSSDGALEDFYCSCFKNEMKFFEECWENMLNCFKRNNVADLSLKLPHTTGKIYSYVDLFDAYRTSDYKNTKGKRHYFDEGLWEFNFDTNDNLKRLVSFFEVNLQ